MDTSLHMDHRIHKKTRTHPTTRAFWSFSFHCRTFSLSTALKNGEFNGTSTADELLKIYAMYERAVLYDWALCKGKYSLTAYSDKLLPHVLDQFVEGF